MITLIHPLFWKKKGNLFNPLLWCSFGGCPGTVGIHHRPIKSTEHTEPGGALALGFGEEGQLASEQEVLGLIRQRETPLGCGSQQSVGTSLACPLARGALMENGGEGAGSSVLTLDFELQSQHSGPLLTTTSSLSLTALTDGSLVCCTLTLPHFLMNYRCQHADLKRGSFTVNLKIIILCKWCFSTAIKLFTQFLLVETCQRGQQRGSTHFTSFRMDCFLFETSSLKPCVDLWNGSLVSRVHLKFELIDHIDHLESFVLIKCCHLGQVHTELLSSEHFNFNRTESYSQGILGAVRQITRFISCLWQFSIHFFLPGWWLHRFSFFFFFLKE